MKDSLGLYFVREMTQLPYVLIAAARSTKLFLGLGFML